MADSDNSTTLPAVMQGRSDRLDAIEAFHTADADPALALHREWSHAQHVALVLCRLQQRLERRVLNARAKALDYKTDYAVAYQAEVEAATAALKLQDKLPRVQAHSLLGIVAKLEIILGSDRDIDDPTDFPWPHIASVLDDLKRIAGSLPIERPVRSAVHADCRRYQAIAADLVSLETHVADAVPEPESAFSRKS